MADTLRLRYHGTIRGAQRLFRVVSLVIALSCGVAPITYAQERFDGRVVVRILEHWFDLRSPGLPSLYLDVNSVQQYPTTGYCMAFDSLRTGDTLIVTLGSVNLCASVVGNLIAPAGLSIRLASEDSTSRPPALIKLRHREREDVYRLSINWQLMRLDPVTPQTLSVLADSLAVARVQRHTIAIACVPSHQDPLLCSAFLRVALFRGHMSAESFLPWSRSALGLLPDTTTPQTRGVFIAREGVRDTALLAAARDFTRVFDGRSDAAYNPELHVSMVLWDGRRFDCYRGICTGDR